MLDHDDVILIEAMPQSSYRVFHLPGAINIPLDQDFEKAVQRIVPDTDYPVVVYCLDDDCESSYEACERLEELGYEVVYDYRGGKVDWNEAGLPVEP
jgi:rhodanese-related sulfurtransferase